MKYLVLRNHILLLVKLVGESQGALDLLEELSVGQQRPGVSAQTEIKLGHPWSD